MSDKTKEKLKKLLYCCDGLSVDYNNSNYGDAREWLRHIATAYSDYQEAVDSDEDEEQDALCCRGLTI